VGDSVVLRINGQGGSVNTRSEIGFHYAGSGTNIPDTIIGSRVVSSSGVDKSAFYIATRDVTTNTAPTERFVVDTTGNVTISSSTAGSAGAGALVVTGGLSAGNNGNASYFGGAVTIAGTGLTATNASGSVEFSGSRSSTGAGVTVTYKTGATPNWFHGLRGLVSNNWYLFNEGTSTNTLIFDYANNSATFAGTVIAPAATASLAPLRIPHGTAPTSPTNGDMWSTTAGLFIRINGVTKTVTLT